MPVKIRLQRHGKKGYPVYHVIAADSRAPRDGKFIEKLGIYNPNTNPASVEVNFDRALYWLQTGAQPTDTVRSILSKEGVLMKKHLLEGVKKNALTAEQAEAKFQAWVAEKQAQLTAKKESMLKAKADDKKERLAAEAKVKEARAAAIAKKAAEATAVASEPATEGAEDAQAE